MPYSRVGQGSCSSIYFAYCMELMKRKRQIEVLPYQTDIVVRSLFPIWFWDDGNLRSMAEENLKRCVAVTPANDPLHIYLGGDRSQVFWLKPELLPEQPQNGVSLVELWVGHEFYHPIMAWYKKAEVIQEAIGGVEGYLWDFFEQVEYGSDIKTSWPEIYHFIAPHVTIPATQQQRKGRYKAGIGGTPSRDNRDKVIQHLAGTTLLKPYDCHAWVDFSMEDASSRR